MNHNTTTNRLTARERIEEAESLPFLPYTDIFDAQAGFHPYLAIGMASHLHLGQFTPCGHRIWRTVS